MSSSKRTLKVGTRESKLARLQTDLVIDLLSKADPSLALEVVSLSTSGDKVLDRPIAALGSTGVFVKELEDALLKLDVDIVVHSLKDLPTKLPEGLMLASVLLREDPRDVFVGGPSTTFASLKPGSRVATSSRRRSAQLSALRNDIVFTDVRGNVPTRLRKLDEGESEGMCLAAAGLLRLGFEARINHYFEPDESVPAAGQGALAIECREKDGAIIELLASINDKRAAAETTAERAFLSQLGGGCSLPIGALGRLADDGTLTLKACIADGTRLAKGELSGALDDAANLGVRLAEQMLADGAQPILDAALKRPQKTISAP